MTIELNFATLTPEQREKLRAVIEATGLHLLKAKLDAEDRLKAARAALGDAERQLRGVESRVAQINADHDRLIAEAEAVRLREVERVEAQRRKLLAGLLDEPRARHAEALAAVEAAQAELEAAVAALSAGEAHV